MDRQNFAVRLRKIDEAAGEEVSFFFRAMPQFATRDLGTDVLIGDEACFTCQDMPISISWGWRAASAAGEALGRPRKAAKGGGQVELELETVARPASATLPTCVPWKLQLYSAFDVVGEHKHALCGGDIVALHHISTSLSLMATRALHLDWEAGKAGDANHRDFTKAIFTDVDLELRKGHGELDLRCSWIIEPVERKSANEKNKCCVDLSGQVLSWSTEFRLRQLTTDLYLNANSTQSGVAQKTDKDGRKITSSLEKLSEETELTTVWCFDPTSPLELRSVQSKIRVPLFGARTLMPQVNPGPLYRCGKMT